MSKNETLNDDLVSQAYKDIPPDNPPAALDDAILAASRREVNSRPKSLFAKWKVPVSIAAVLTLSVSVIFTMYDQYGTSVFSDGLETTVYHSPESASANYSEPELATETIIDAENSLQEQTVATTEENSNEIEAAGAPAVAAAMVADIVAPLPAPPAMNKFAADDIASITDSRQESRALESKNIQAIKEKEQQLIAEISEMQTMQEELKLEKQQITKDLERNELKQNRMTAKVSSLTKKLKTENLKERAVLADKAVQADIQIDPWLRKIKSLWQDDNKELARIELKRYLEMKKIDKAKLKDKLPAELLELSE